jgi:hypothetical protein
MCKTCEVSPNYGYARDMKAVRCKRHKEEDMIKIVNIGEQIERLISEQVKQIVEQNNAECERKVQSVMNGEC